MPTGQIAMMDDVGASESKFGSESKDGSDERKSAEEKSSSAMDVDDEVSSFAASTPTAMSDGGCSISTHDADEGFHVFVVDDAEFDLDCITAMCEENDFVD